MLQQQPECVCKSSSSLPPLSFHGIRAWYRLRVEQQAQEAKEGQQEVIISSPFRVRHCIRVWSSSRSTSKRHRIEELSGARREAPTNDIGSRIRLRQDEAIGTIRNFGAETAFLHHLDLCFESAGIRALFGQDVRRHQSNC